MDGAVANSQMEVHKVTSPLTFQDKWKPDKCKGRPTLACYRCGKSGHMAYQCKFKGAECYS